MVKIHLMYVLLLLVVAGIPQVMAQTIVADEVERQGKGMVQDELFEVVEKTAQMAEEYACKDPKSESCQFVRQQNNIIDGGIIIIGISSSAAFVFHTYQKVIGG